MKKLIILALLFVAPLQTFATNILCLTNPTSANPYYLKQIAPTKYDVYRLDVEERTIDIIQIGSVGHLAKKINDSPYELSTEDGGVVTIKGTWGSRFGITGYYGDKTFRIYTTTRGQGTLHNHVIPHFFADVNAPQAEHTVVTELSCQVVQ